MADEKQAGVDNRRMLTQESVQRVQEVRCYWCKRAFRVRQEPWSGEPLEPVYFCPYCGKKTNG